MSTKYKVISTSSSGNSTVIAAVAGYKIVVLSYVVTALTAVRVRFDSATGGTALTGQLCLAANGVVNGAFNPRGHFETIVGEALCVNLSSAVSTTGHITYVLRKG